VSLLHYYQPREFTCVILVAVYISPCTVTKTVCDIISSFIVRLQTQHPKTFMVISGEFKPISLSAIFQHFVNPREDKKLDLFYANVSNVHISSALPPLGKSDHNLIFHTSDFTPIVKQQSVTAFLKRWSQEAEQTLNGCFEATDRNAI